MRRNLGCFSDESTKITVVSEWDAAVDTEHVVLWLTSTVCVSFSSQVSKYEIPVSQETPSTSVTKKKRKFSEPKEHF